MPTEDWKRSLADGIGRLGRWFEGRYLLDDPASPEAVPATRYFEPDFLRRIIWMTAQRWTSICGSPSHG